MMGTSSYPHSVYTDQPIFDAMAAATSIDIDKMGFARIVLDASRFIEVFNNHRDRALCTSINAVAQVPMRADIAQMIDAGWKTGKSSSEVAEEILREFGASTLSSTDRKCTCGYLHGHADDCPAISSTKG